MGDSFDHHLWNGHRYPPENWIGDSSPQKFHFTITNLVFDNRDARTLEEDLEGIAGDNELEKFGGHGASNGQRFQIKGGRKKGDGTHQHSITFQIHYDDDIPPEICHGHMDAAHTSFSGIIKLDHPEDNIDGPIAASGGYNDYSARIHLTR